MNSVAEEEEKVEFDFSCAIAPLMANFTPQRQCASRRRRVANAGLLQEEQVR